MIIKTNTFFKDIATANESKWYSTKNVDKEKINNIDIFNSNTWVPSNAFEENIIAQSIVKKIDFFIFSLNRFENVESFKKDYQYRFYKKYIRDNKELVETFSIKVNSISDKNIKTINFVKELITCWKHFCLNKNRFDLDYLSFFSDQIKKIKKYAEYNYKKFCEEFCDGYVFGNAAFYFTVNSVVSAYKLDF